MKQRKKSFGMRISAFVLSFAMVCTLLAGVNVVAFAADDVQTVPVAKFYNDAKKGGDGEHLFTKDQDEMSWLTSLPTWNNEGVAWKAPVSSSTSVYRCYNPNSGEHLYVDEDYADYLAATGWNKEKVAFYSDDEMGVPVYRLWNGQDGVGSHHFTTDEGEVDWLVSQGWTKEDIAFFGVDDGTIVKSAELIDESGLQTDGTAYYTDTLRVTYTADLGNPTQITWYKDGTAVKTSTSSSIGGLAFTLVPSGSGVSNPAGTWYAVITNTKGETYASNTLEVTKVAAPAVISELEFSQDYTYGVDKNNGTSGIDYASKTDKIIATFKVNKDYDGYFGAVDAKKVAAGNVTVNDVIGTVSTAMFDVENTQSQFTDAEALEDHDLLGLAGSKFVNKDGSVVYKWVVDEDYDFDTFTGTLERGESYVVGFNQTDVSTPTDPKTYIVAGPVVAPYVDAPAAVAVTKAEAGQPIELAFVDAEGNKLEWMGRVQSGAAIDVGIQNAIMYKNTENVAGKGTNLNNGSMDVKKGALKASNNAVGDTNFQYYSATVTFKKGIYGDKQLTLTSPTKTIATSSMKAMSLYNNQSAPTTATIKFNNLVTSGMVAVLHTDYAKFQDDVKAVSQGDKSKITGMAQVARGTSKVDIEDAIDSVDDEAVGYDLYVPLFLPDNAEEYTAVYPTVSYAMEDFNTAMMDIPDAIGDQPGDTKALNNTQVATFFSLASNVSKMNIATGAPITVTLNNGEVKLDTPTGGDMNLLEVYDQYGDELEASEDHDDYKQALTAVPFELKKTSSLPTPGTNQIFFTVRQIGSGGVHEFNNFTGFTLSGVDGEVANSTWQATTPAGQTITVKFDANSDMTVTISGLL